MNKEYIKECLLNKKLPENSIISLGLLSIAKETTALANTSGGLIILGMDNNFVPHNTRKLDYYVNTIKTTLKNFSISLSLSYDFIKINKYVIVLLTVDELPIEKKLCSIGLKTYMVRNKKVVNCTSFQKNYYSQIKGDINYECLHKNEYYLKHIDLDFLEKFYNVVKSISDYSISKSIINRRYRLYNNDLAITLTMIMCFSYCPQISRPNADILIYDDRNTDQLLVHRVDGNIYHMLNEALIFLKKYLGMSLYINKDRELVRKEAYPIVVLKEVIYNALVHRDYSTVSLGISTEIHILDSSIIITNPGCYLYEGYQDADVIKIPRNKHIKKVNDLLLSTPKDERGIESVFLNMKNYGYVKPEFFYEDGIYKVTLFNNTIYDFYNSSISIHKICEFCESPKSREEIYQHFKPNGKSTPYHFIKKYILPLVKQNILCLTIEDHVESKNQKYFTNTKIEK